MIFEWMSDPSAWVGLLTLVVLEIVLGIDNLVFIAILAFSAVGLNCLGGDTDRAAVPYLRSSFLRTGFDSSVWWGVLVV